MRIAIPLTIVSGAFMLVGPTLPSVHAADFCRLSSNAVVKACQAAARHDGSVAESKCLNLGTPLERRICGLEANASTKDALKTLWRGGRLPQGRLCALRAGSVQPGDQSGELHDYDQ